MGAVRDELAAELFAMTAEGLEVSFRPAGSFLPGLVEIRIQGSMGEERAIISFAIDPEREGEHLVWELRRRREKWIGFVVDSMATKRAEPLPPHAAGSFAMLREPDMREWIMGRLRESLRTLARRSHYMSCEMEEFARRMEETSFALGCRQTAMEILREVQDDVGYPLGRI